MISFRTPRLFAAAAILVAGGLGSAASAVTTINSSAYGLSANLTLLSFAGANAGPYGSIGGLSLPAFTQTGGVASVNQTLALGVQGLTSITQALRTGVITTTANGNATTGQGSATVNNLATGLSTQLPLAVALNVLGIGATTITSTTSVSAVGPLSAIGSATLTGLTVNGSALALATINGSAFTNPAANTVLLDVLGLRITLNEQLTTGNGTTALGLTTNALHATFSNFLVGGGLLSGDVIVGNSSAGVTSVADAVPEPAIWLQMIGGLALVGVHLRRRRPTLRAA